MPAFAIFVKEENEQAIRSEKPDFNREEFLDWVSTGGWFIRDEHTAFDCKYMAKEVFDTIYMVEIAQPGTLFKRIIKR